MDTLHDEYKYVAVPRLDAEDATVERVSWLIVLGLVTLIVWVLR